MSHDGVKECGNYVAKVGEINHRCCGGRITKYAVVNCLKRGRVNARDDCKESCAFCTLSKTKSVSPTQNNSHSLEEDGWRKVVGLVEGENQKHTKQKSGEHVPSSVTIDGVRKSFWEKWADEINVGKLKHHSGKVKANTHMPKLDWKHFKD